jgi:mitochondrial enoyl-[acyl-carrier protein] reductase / trans-2-enoyl-CoA reductase
MEAMKAVLIDRYGAPEQVARCAEVPDVGAPGAGEVVFDVLLFPINPADVSFCRGTYRLRPPLPATPGAECVGRVTAVGAGVTHVRPGDLVITLQRENWAQKRRVKGYDVIPVPPMMDLHQAAMLRINPATALLLLTSLVTVKPGEWVVQNVANSAVGRLLIPLARAREIRTVNVVRRASVFSELEKLGGELCLVDGENLAERVQEKTGGGTIRLGLDAVSGRATQRIAECVSEDGVVCNYGSMSGEDPVMSRPALSGRGVALVGFTLTRPLSKYPLDTVRALYADLARQVTDGTLTAPVEKVYPIEAITDALAHAQRGERRGKILVAPNGPV